MLKKFILKLLDKNDPTSSKRFVGLCAVFTTIGLAITGTLAAKGICPVFMYNGLLLFAAGAFAINGMETIFNKKENAASAPPLNEKDIKEKGTTNDEPQ